MLHLFKLRRELYFLVVVALAIGLLLHVTNGATTGQDVDLRQLARPNGFKMLGSAAGEMTGSTVSDAGDVNKDGLGDIIVGSSVATSGSSATAYVVFGNSSSNIFAINFASMVAGPTTGFRITGFTGSCRASGAGDINGDGAGDVIVGVPSASRAYVIFGADAALPGYTVSDITGTSMSSTIGFTIFGNSDNAGSSVSRAGDVNDDGVDDLLIGAHYGAPPSIGGVYRPNAGIVFVLFGRDVPGGAPPFSDVYLSGMNGNTDQGFRIFGVAANDQLGVSPGSVSRAGDLNGDSIDDIIVGAYSATVPGNTGVGMAYVVFGRSHTLGAPSYTDIDLYYNISQSGTKGFKIYGAGNDDKTGFSVGAAGDVNGDGLDDVIVGAYGGSPTPLLTAAGIAYVIYGRNNSAGAPPFNDIMLESISTSPAAGFRIFGAVNSDGMGRSVSGAGDVNGDGVADLIVGAYLADPFTLSGGSNAGAAFVIFGRNVASGAQPFHEVQLSSIKTGSTMGFRILGAAVNDNAGMAVSRAGDVNGDGIDDVIVGAYAADPPNFFNAGTSYVIYGAISDPTSQPSSQPSRQPSTQPSVQPSSQPIGMPTSQPSVQPTSSPTGQPSSQPSSQPSMQPFSQPSSQPTQQPSSRPTLQPSVHPTGQPSQQPVAVPTSAPSSRPSTQPTTQPTANPSGQPSTQPTTRPTVQPSSQPSLQPTDQPTSAPSAQPFSLPTATPSVQPSVQPSGQPTDQPNGIPSSQPSVQPSEQPSVQPSSRPSSQPTAKPSSQPSSQPSRQPSSQPTEQPSSQPSEAPTTQPSCAPSVQPLACPTVQPSSQPSVQPVAPPTSLPTSQPSVQPSSQPSQQPSLQPRAVPSSQPTSSPSARPTDAPLGEWSVVLPHTPVLVSISTAVVLARSYIWVCGGSSEGLCLLLEADTGVAQRQYKLPQSVYSVVNTHTADKIVLSGHVNSTDIKSSSTARCSVTFDYLTCDERTFDSVFFTTASYVSFPDQMVYLGQYHSLASATIVDVESNTAQSYTYKIYNMESVELTQIQSPPSFAGSFVAGTGVRSAGSPVNYIIAGMLRTAHGGLTAMRMYPQDGTIVNKATLVTDMALEPIGPDSFVVGSLELSDGTGQHAYLLRTNALFNSVVYCVRYRINTGWVSNSSSSSSSSSSSKSERRALSMVDSANSKSVVRSVTRVENSLFMTIESLSSVPAANSSLVTVLQTSASSGAIVKQVNIGAVNGSLSCSKITSSGLFLTMLCSLQPIGSAAENRSTVILSTNKELLFRKLPPGFTRTEIATFRVEEVPFLRTTLSVSSTKADIPTSHATYNTVGAAPSQKPSSAPTDGPSAHPSYVPSSQPSSSPTVTPSVSPQPSGQPSTSRPSNTNKPTKHPPVSPFPAPSIVPSTKPSIGPTLNPTARPSVPPSTAPSVTPSIAPTPGPSNLPLTKRTRAPSRQPSLRQTPPPSALPTGAELVTVSEDHDGQDSLVIGVSVGSVLFLCISCYALFKYKQRQVWKEMRVKRREEIFAYESAEAARVLHERAEMMEAAAQAAACRAARRERREERRKRSDTKATQRGAQAITPVPVPAEVSEVSAHDQIAPRVTSTASSESSFNISSLHSSEKSGHSSCEVDLNCRRSEFSDFSDFSDFSEYYKNLSPAVSGEGAV